MEASRYNKAIDATYVKDGVHMFVKRARLTDEEWEVIRNKKQVACYLEMDDEIEAIVLSKEAIVDPRYSPSMQRFADALDEDVRNGFTRD